MNSLYHLLVIGPEVRDGFASERRTDKDAFPSQWQASPAASSVGHSRCVLVGVLLQSRAAPDFRSGQLQLCRPLQVWLFNHTSAVPHFRLQPRASVPTRCSAAINQKLNPKQIKLYSGATKGGYGAELLIRLLHRCARCRGVVVVRR